MLKILEIVAMVGAVALLAASPLLIAYAARARRTAVVQSLVAARADLALGERPRPIFTLPWTAPAPSLYWTRPGIVGVFAFVDPMGKTYHGAALHVLLDAWFPPSAIESKGLLRLATFGMFGPRVACGDAPFDRGHVIESALPSYVPALCDARGRELVTRIEAAVGRVAISVSGRYLGITVRRRFPRAPELTALFALAEEFVAHLDAIGGVPAPAGLCDRCGWGINDGGVRCPSCGAHQHEVCARQGGGCVSARCDGSGRTPLGLLRRTTSPDIWSYRQLRDPRPEDFGC